MLTKMTEEDWEIVLEVFEVVTVGAGRTRTRRS